MDTVNSTNDSLFLPWNNHYNPQEFAYDGVPPPVYNDHNSFYSNNTYHNPAYPTGQPQQRVINDHLLPDLAANSSVASNYNYNSNSNNNINGITHYNNITMPAVAAYDNDTNSVSPSSGPHYSPKYSPKQSPNGSAAPRGHSMNNMMKMNEMMKEMKQHMNDMMIITNMNNMKAMLNHTAKQWENNQNNHNNHHKQSEFVNMPLIPDHNSQSQPRVGYATHAIHAAHSPHSSHSAHSHSAHVAVAKGEADGRERMNKKRRLEEYMESEDEDSDESESNYPEIGVRATTTIQLSKHLFIGDNLLHFDISREILLAALKRITEYRWIHSKYKINAAKDVKYFLFINESDITFLPKAFQENKRKRGRPPKHKKIKLDEGKNKDMKQYNFNVNNDKIYRLNFQIIFRYNIKAQIRSEIIKNIKIDLNKNSLSALLTNVLAQKAAILDNIQSYSLYAVDAFKLKEYEKYESEEEERKKKKREREQKRRENKKKEGILSP